MYKHLLTVLMVCFLLPFQPCQAKAKKPPGYKVEYSGTFVPERGVVATRIKVTQSRHVLRLLDLDADPEKYSEFTGDGDIRRDGNRLMWSVPSEGGSLAYDVRVDSDRGLLLDARMTEEWA
ncbi:MAG: hypothetical protein ACREO9_01410, partial [Lysobacterales bacterium]